MLLAQTLVKKLHTILKLLKRSSSFIKSFLQIFINNKNKLFIFFHYMNKESWVFDFAKFLEVSIDNMLSGLAKDIFQDCFEDRQLVWVV